MLKNKVIMKTNKQFRSAASEKVADRIKQIDYSQYARNGKEFSRIGTIFSTRWCSSKLIKLLKEIK